MWLSLAFPPAPWNGWEGGNQEFTGGGEGEMVGGAGEGRRAEKVKMGVGGRSLWPCSQQRTTYTGYDKILTVVSQPLVHKNRKNTADENQPCYE